MREAIQCTTQHILWCKVAVGHQKATEDANSSSNALATKYSNTVESERFLIDIQLLHWFSSVSRLQVTQPELDIKASLIHATSWVTANLQGMGWGTDLKKGADQYCFWPHSGWRIFSARASWAKNLGHSELIWGSQHREPRRKDLFVTDMWAHRMWLEMGSLRGNTRSAHTSCDFSRMAGVWV